jgi:hypothetical protein
MPTSSAASGASKTELIVICSSAQLNADEERVREVSRAK